MKIERLLVQVSPADYAKDFLTADAEVWTPWLKQQQGFLNKTSRVVSSGLVELLVFWKSAADMEKAGSKKSEIRRMETLMQQRYPGRHRLVYSS